MSKDYQKGLKDLAKEAMLYPQEAPLKVGATENTFIVGIPKESFEQENRVALTPNGVELMVQNGIQVMVETGAGSYAKYSDREYSEAGAKIVYSPSEAFDADIVIKVQPPTVEEIDMMKKSSTLMSTAPLRKVTKELINKLNEQKITAVGFGMLEDKGGQRPVVRAMSEIAGSTVMMVAAENLNTVQNGKGIILGGITGVPASKVVIIGAGTVAEYTARTAIGLGAEVKIFANHLYKLRRIKQNLHTQIYTSIIDPKILAEAVKEADVVVGAMLADEDRSPCVVSEEMVSQMKPNSVIIDVSIDQGGCFETSRPTNHKNPTFKKHDVIHYCVPNIASRVAQTASMALNNIFAPIFIQFQRKGGVENMMLSKEWFLKSVYTYKGYVTNQVISKRLNLSYKELKLLFVARL